MIADKSWSWSGRYPPQDSQRLH
ncbi:hypothetical protein V12B01_13030 [Vibrio splendidus 12B01]|nr:hypothetical protein V12B01_13030 [Vibrio splendidus 12B01]EAQ54986.1 hypothetical protein MED222_05210 [Vibrio sp. MED222]